MSSDPNAEAKTQQVKASGVLTVNVRSGRQVNLQVPLDWTEIDTLDLISYLSVSLERELSAARGGSRLVVPTGPLGSSRE